MIERDIRMASFGPPPVVANTRAVAPCGCAVYVGKRLDNQEPFIGATACSDRHHGRMGDFLEAFKESLDRPEPTPAVEVADELLMMVFAEGTA